jgi:5-methyltetrahydropteroyltriglutamate--homocysteine methyltransferase
MKMPLTAQLGGIHPRSEQLIDLTRSYDRGKTDRQSLEEQFEQDTRELVGLEEEAGFESFTDGALQWQDQLRPVVESLEGVTTGTRYSRWFDTNTFYKKPTVNGKIGLAQFDQRKFIRTDLLPRSKIWKVTLVGPYTFSELADNLHYNSRSDLLSDLAQAEHEIIQRLAAAGVSQFQISEPCLVYQPYRQEALNSNELASALDALRRTVEGSRVPITVQTYFGDATRILPDLLRLPVDGVGLDLFETDWLQLKIKTEKTLALGIVDSRESNVEEPKWIAETATRVSKHIVSDRVILAPNSDLKFLPRKVADSKARSLVNATKLVGEAS